MEIGGASTVGYAFDKETTGAWQSAFGRIAALTAKLPHVLEITMPSRAFIACISFITGMAMSGFFDLETVAFGCMALVATYSSQAVYNCIKDIESDKVNAPWRPLASGALSTGFAWQLMFLLVSLGFLFAYLASPWMALVNAAFIVLGVFYSCFAKARHILSYVTLVTTHMVMPILCGYLLFGQMDARIAVVVVFIYLTEVLAMSIKDYKDVEGDRKVGMRTLPIVLGPEKAAMMTFAGFCMPLVLVWIPWLVLHLSLPFLALSVASGAGRLVLGLRLLLNPSQQSGMWILDNFRYFRILQIFAWCLA